MFKTAVPSKTPPKLKNGRCKDKNSARGFFNINDKMINIKYPTVITNSLKTPRFIPTTPPHKINNTMTTSITFKLNISIFLPPNHILSIASIHSK